MSLSLVSHLRGLRLLSLRTIPTIAAAFTLLALANPIAAQPPAAAQLRLGSAWYPEQWPESRWDADLTLMEQAHMNVVRVGEFAWSTLEPAEGRYALDWLDRAITLAAKHHIAVVIGTPTDAPPAWLTSKYPETLGTNADGRLREHGNRRQFNYANPRYRQLCALIVGQLARRFGHNRNVIGWQIGNEYTDESFDPATRAQFQQFLKAKYKTLASLNDHWSTAYWSQTYDRWDEIPLVATGGNPGLLLEHKHFVTETWRSFQKNQIDVLRPLILPSQFITTNIGGLAWSDNWDHYAITADLDLASWDEYVGQGHLDAPKEAMLNDFVRGWKRQNFWVMETEPGSVNWAPINNTLSPGETRALAWQAIGHGADAILYWQWRSALNGQEQYHGAIVGPDGQPNPIYAEIAQLGRDLELTNAALAGTSPHAEIALLHTYDSRWAIDFQPHTKEYDQEQVLLRFYTPLQQLAESKGQSVDIVDPTGPVDLSQYKLLVAPSLNVIDESLAAKLLAYVKNGGHLLLGPRSGMKDEFDSLNPQRQPGPLADALGGRVEQYYVLDKGILLSDPDNPAARTFAPMGSGSIWAEQLTPSSPDTRIELSYTEPEEWLDQKAAMLMRKLGKGSISYLGTIPNSELMSSLLSRIASGAGVTAAELQLPANVELAARSNAASFVYVLINHALTLTSVTLPQPMKNLLFPSQGEVKTIDLPTQGVAVLVSEPSK